MSTIRRKKKSRAKGFSQEVSREATREDDLVGHTTEKVDTTRRRKKKKRRGDLSVEHTAEQPNNDCKAPVKTPPTKKERNCSKERRDNSKDKKKDEEKRKEEEKKKDEDKKKEEEGKKEESLNMLKAADIQKMEEKTQAGTTVKTVVATTMTSATFKDTKLKPVSDNKDGPAKLAELEAQVDIEIAKALISFEWYHGLMPREEINELLIADGDFLVRKTDVGGKPRYAVSVMNKSRIRHILLTYKEGKWYMKDLKKPTLSGLIREHMEGKHPVQADGTVLVKPIQRPEYYILHEHIEVGKKLGGGAFGDVHIGKMKLTDKESVDVAIKKLKGAMNKKQRSEFMKEAKLMRRFDHPNLVRMLGVAAQEEPVMIVLELAMNGCLRSKLKENPDMPNNKLLDYAIGGCRGMCYLAARKVIHRDIAARNCLLGKDDEVKISDFGLSVADQSILKLDKLKAMPIKWLAPETLMKGEFSTKSDVWSFGIMLWEIWNHCKTDPFPNMTNGEAKTKILSKELPMGPPENTPDLIKSVMVLCFTHDPDMRPTFESVFRILNPGESPPPPPPVMPNFETYALPP